MQYYIDSNKNLVITADDEDRKELSDRKRQCEEDGENFVSDRVMEEVLEPLLCNSELEWSDAMSISALTDAPILAIFGREEDIFASGEFNPPTPENNHREVGYRVTGSDSKTIFGERILQAWGYMDYQVRAVQEDLLDYGKAVFTLGWEVSLEK